jgi:hypothetical protein
LNEHQRQALLRRTRTLLAELGYDLSEVTDTQLERCMDVFLGTLREFGAKVREAATGAAGVASTSLKELMEGEK